MYEMSSFLSSLGINTAHTVYHTESIALAYLLRARDKVMSLQKDSSAGSKLPPMLPPQYRPSDFTLVVDLEDTLVHSEWTVGLFSAYIRARPAVTSFLTSGRICSLFPFLLPFFLIWNSRNTDGAL